MIDENQLRLRMRGLMYIKSKADWETERDALMSELDNFAGLLRKRPFENFEGLRGVSAFAFYWFLKKIQPEIVFEVGVWKGFSTWLIEQAAPQAQVLCFDPIFLIEGLLDPSKVGPVYRSSSATYSHQDFSCADLGSLITNRDATTLAFFDDHQNKLPRLLQCKQTGVKHIIFDDNGAAAETHRSLEDDLQKEQTRALLEREIVSYETFPALWPVDTVISATKIHEPGMNFPVRSNWTDIYNDREWHSYVTYVRLR